jgi:hypothetical protein
MAGAAIPLRKPEDVPKRANGDPPDETGDERQPARDRPHPAVQPGLPSTSGEAAPSPAVRGESESPPSALDVRELIRRSSTAVRADSLAGRGKKEVLVLSVAKIEELINRAVWNIVETRERALDLSFESLKQESREEFLRVLGQYQATLRAKRDLETTKATLDRELRALREYLNRQKKMGYVRTAEDFDQSLASRFRQFELELGDIIGKVLAATGSLAAAESPAPGPGSVLESVRAQVKGMIADLVGKEAESILSASSPRDHRMTVLRRRIAQLEEQVAVLANALKTVARSREWTNQQVRTLIRQALPPDGEPEAPGAGSFTQQKLSLMQRRMAKLYEQIEALEAALRTVSSSQLSSHQVHGLLRQVGLWIDDKYHEKKREMLKILLQENLELRRRMQERSEAGSRPGVG